ncbi:MAG: YkgJ family cysteine cluster protein [Woeseiaceae bacterium]|nr:YkgJ family cysteine cluster protein [Woeseiaceae bacterium]
MKDCNSCGRCCQNWGGSGLSASAEDIERWETYRPDIARFVVGDKLWIDPEAGDYFEHCPWLKSSDGGNKFTCDIYEDRPEDCRFYPVSIDDMVKDGCEMLEAGDLENPRRAQRALDAIMIDSRPPCED